MYFYDSLLLISNILILTTQSQSQNAPVSGPGIAMCTYLGTTVSECSYPKDVGISKLPEECTSLAFDSLEVNLYYHVSTSDENYEGLDKILASSKPKYVYYGHQSQEEWTRVLACEVENNGTNSLDEMDGLMAFMNEHSGITGFILTGLALNFYSIEFPGYAENLKKYIEVMKTTIPDIQIGILLPGSFLIDQYLNPQIPWMDIKVVDPSVDFYVISLMWFNDCGKDFIQGIAPMTSKTTNNTLETLKGVLAQAGIPKEKTYFRFRLDPIDDPKSSHNRCDLTIQKVCKNKSDTIEWCYDRQPSFNEKGKFVKENGIGFVTSGIDLNDPYNLCGCEKPYASFYAILNGFNGVESKPCAPLSV